MERCRRVVVVGGGVAGCSAAYALARRGLEVALIEQGRVGQQGASALPLALLNPRRGRSGRARQLDRDGLASVWRLREELEAEGFATGARPGGVLRIASSDRQARQWQRLEGVRWLEPDALPLPYRAPFGAMLVPEGGWLEPGTWLAALTAAAGRLGADIVEGCRLASLERSGDRWRLATSRGDLAAEVVVLCVGASPNPQLPLPEVERMAGEVVALDTALQLPQPLAGAVYGGSLGGCVFIGGNHRAEGQDDPDAPERLRASFAWFVPALAEAPIAAVWTGVRARRQGGSPLLEEQAPGLWTLTALAGRGFLCAGLLAERLAARLAPD